jgi:hypothetical protein
VQGTVRIEQERPETRNKDIQEPLLVFRRPRRLLKDPLREAECTAQDVEHQQAQADQPASVEIDPYREERREKPRRASLSPLQRLQDGQFGRKCKVGDDDGPWTAVHRHQRKANAGGPKRSSGMPGLPVPAPIEEQYVGAQREPRHQIDAAQVERAVSQPIWDLREPLGVHPGLAGNGKGVGLGADEVMCGAQYACVRQVPPQVRVPKQLD